MTRALPHPAVENNHSRLLDVVATFDTTGSMSDKIQGLVESMAEMVAFLGKLQLGWRFAAVPFGDLTVPGDRIVADLPFVADVASAQAQLRALPRFSGGSNIGESSAEAMLVALDRDFRPNAVKVVILVTDEPALGPAALHESVGHRLGAMDVVCFTIAPGCDYFRDWAHAHGGTWQPIGPTIDATALRRLFEEVMHNAVRIADEVHTHHGGSVRRYLERVSTSTGTARRLTRAALPPPAEPARRQLSRVDERALPPGQGDPPPRRLGPGRP